MIPQLLLAKRQFLEGMAYAKRPDPVSCGIAISLFQDAAEMLVWALIKARNISVKDSSPFTTNLELLQKDGLTVPEAPRLLELNKARVGFKHYGNLPAPDEARKYQSYVEDFLRSAATTQFGQDIDQLSLVDLVPFEDVRGYLKSAEAHIAKGDLSDAVHEASIAKVILFAKLAKHIPKVDCSLADADRVIAHVAELSGLTVFGYVAQYLDMLRDLSIISLLRVPLDDYAFLDATLFHATQSMASTWQMSNKRLMTYDEATCKRQITCLVDISIRLAGVT